MATLEGWIFDSYPAGTEIAVWVIDQEGQAHCLRDRFAPSFFVGGDPKEQRALGHWLIDQRWEVRPAWSERTDLFLGCTIRVLQVEVRRPDHFRTVFERVASQKPNLPYYNADISIPQMYFLERGVFPLAFCRFLIDEGKKILGMELQDSPWTLDYPLPPLKRLGIRMEGDALNPNHGYCAPLEIETEDGVRVLNGEEPAEMLETLRVLLLRYDPDLIVTDWGDSFILPHLLKLAQQHKISLPFNRDPARPPLFRPAKSYFSYGRIVYKTSSQFLFGRWHIDRENAFLTEDYGLEGALELARLTCIPVQRVVRTSTGTDISAMQIAEAYRRGILIPWHKHEPEKRKTAKDLVICDKDGMVHQPVLGLHEDVAEIDFVSMYPSIMARLNVSPETMNCRCCRNHRVPEIGYAICQQRRGLVPDTIAPLIAKRVEYTRQAKAMEKDDPQREIYRRRQSAHKWLLATCPSYLGHENARFGKLEAHESVTAYGRECLLRAKEVAERRGFRVLQANVDSLFVQKRGTSREGYDALLKEITRVTNIPIALEGIYRWVAFLPSRVDADMSVANRYVGAFEGGELKMRGIETRRHDTPPFVAAAEEAMLNILAEARSRKEMEGRIPRVLEMACAYADALRSGTVPYQELVIRKRLSKDPLAYTKDKQLAIAAKELVERGVALSPGESIQYVITEQHADVPCDRVRALAHYRSREPYDAQKYIDLLVRAVETVLIPLGINAPQIEAQVKAIDRDGEQRALPPPRRTSLRPLFDWADAKERQLASRGRPGGKGRRRK